MEEDKKGYGDTLITINSPEFIDRLSEIKAADSGITWVDVADKVNGEFSLDLSPTRISDLYKKEITREVTVNRQANKRLDKYVDTIGERYEAIANTTERYHNLVKKTMTGLEQCETFELLERIPDMLKAGKQVETVWKMGVGQIELIRSEQDKLTITQKEGVFTDEQVKTELFKQLPKILSMLDAQGKIRIVDKHILES